MHLTVIDQKKLKFFCILFISLIFILMSVFVCKFLAEHVFYDKLFYKKSAYFGYSATEWSDPRTKDLQKYFLQPTISTSPVTDPKHFTVVIIGDSFVYGVGTKTSQRFSMLLEQHLNKIRPTKVIVLGESGSSFLDNYIKYSVVKNRVNANLYIIGLVDNDLILNRPNLYDQDLADRVTNACPGQQVFLQNSDELGDYNKKLELAALPNSANVCVFKSLVNQMPHNAIYFDFHSIKGYYNYMDVYKNALKENHFYFMNSLTFYSSHRSNYNVLLNTGHDPWQVSSKEKHPSALANQLFADTLFQEITTNSAWKFNDK